MDETAIVALVTGVATIVASMAGAFWSLLAERTRLRHATGQQRLEREYADTRELRLAFADAQSAVLRLGLAVGISINMREDRNARLDGEDLPDQFRQARAEYLSAKVAIERLWHLCPLGSHTKTAELSDAVTEAFSHARSLSSPTVPAEHVERILQNALRALGDEVFPPAPQAATVSKREDHAPDRRLSAAKGP